MLARERRESVEARGKSENKVRRLEEELATASALAAVSVTERVPGLGDAELKELEDAVCAEQTRRLRLAMEREMRAEAQAEARADMEREREATRAEREA